MRIILITGATDGIGLETARMLAGSGHKLLLHGRNPKKLEAGARAIAEISGAEPVETYLADLSDMKQTAALADAVSAKHDRLDVLINNAGVLATPKPITADGLDIRFAVNTLAPYLLTKRLLPLLGRSGRVVNLSSAAQAPVDLQALAGRTHLSHNAAYAQSKLAITIWTRFMAVTNPEGPMIVAVNPGSLLGSKMVKESYGVSGGDLRIGADILARAATSAEFEGASGKYYDNDARRFSPPNPTAQDAAGEKKLVQAMEQILTRLT
ncbi:SDR family NAD(P)-dependent oxidoreductase [Tropicimonas sp. TH_r6]|uniref:SDR family NAD(P)-dependent oxidoreductase n=1 Tax=Tropicimonas sp. TH_r6 TaxID=3082085 RepID=UPI0029558B5C|nr:SDR family NAD(P)-dependent oxidoreductase [Tropicimonas sp. TH_r6]MDV7145858.1 SDR family NAD(P)-dependent oxidoreductase [Tropicimonas sp. TH_r6]